MRAKRSAKFVRCALGVLVACAPIGAQQNPAVDWEHAKAIFRDAGDVSAQAARFEMLDLDGRPVSVAHDFHSGERVRFQFELKRDGFVYVFNTTTEGDPTQLLLAHAKGVDLVPDPPPAPRPARIASPRAEPGAIQPAPASLLSGLTELLPAPGSTPAITRKGTSVSLERFEFDPTPGIETLVIVVSPSPLDVTRLVAPWPPPTGGYDTDGAAIANLSKGLLDALSANASVAVVQEDRTAAHGERGIRRDSDSYAVARNPNEPFSVQVFLKHYQ